MKTEILLSGNSGNTERIEGRGERRVRRRVSFTVVTLNPAHEGNGRTRGNANHLYFDLERPTRDPRNRG